MAAADDHVSIKITTELELAATTMAAKKKRYLPAEILVNILIRLPASTLQNLKPVNKQWFRILSDQDFAEEHLHAPCRQLGGFILCHRNPNNNFIISREEEEAEAVVLRHRCLNLPVPPNPNPSGCLADFFYRVVVPDGSCKGLVLCHFEGRPIDYFHIVNPITRQRIWLPCLHADLLITASIGCSSCNHRDIKVVVLGVLDKLVVAWVLTLGGGGQQTKTMRWRKVMASSLPKNRMTPYRFNKPRPVLVRGAFHWTYHTGILSLDLHQEKFSMTDVPFSSFDRLRHHNLLLELDGCLAVVTGCPCHPSDNIWVLKKEEDSLWTERPGAVDFASFNLPCPSEDPSSGRAVLSLRGGDLVVFCKREEEEDIIRLLVYDVGRGETTTYAQFDRKEHLSGDNNSIEFSIMTHTNSMVSCKANNSPSWCRSILEVLLILGIGAVLIWVFWHYITKH